MTNKKLPNLRTIAGTTRWAMYAIWAISSANAKKTSHKKYWDIQIYIQYWYKHHNSPSVDLRSGDCVSVWVLRHGTRDALDVRCITRTPKFFVQKSDFKVRLIPREIRYFHESSLNAQQVSPWFTLVESESKYPVTSLSFSKKCENQVGQGFKHRQEIWQDLTPWWRFSSWCLSHKWLPYPMASWTTKKVDHNLS